MNYKKLKIFEGQRINQALNQFFEDETDKNIALLSAIHGKPEDYYASLPMGELVREVEKTGWMAHVPKNKFLRPFRSGLYVYKLKVIGSQLSKDEFVMFQKVNAEDAVNKLHESMSILMTKYFLFRSKWTRVRYTAEQHKKTSELFKQKMSFAMAYACNVFFLESYPVILQAGLSYLEGIKEAAEELQQTP